MNKASNKSKLSKKLKFISVASTIVVCSTVASGMETVYANRFTRFFSSLKITNPFKSRSGNSGDLTNPNRQSTLPTATSSSSSLGSGSSSSSGTRGRLQTWWSRLRGRNNNGNSTQTQTGNTGGGNGIIYASIDHSNSKPGRPVGNSRFYTNPGFTQEETVYSGIRGTINQTDDNTTGTGGTSPAPRGTLWNSPGDSWDDIYTPGGGGRGSLSTISEGDEGTSGGSTNGRNSPVIPSAPPEDSLDDILASPPLQPTAPLLNDDDIYTSGGAGNNTTSIYAQVQRGRGNNTDTDTGRSPGLDILLTSIRSKVEEAESLGIQQTPGRLTFFDGDDLVNIRATSHGLTSYLGSDGRLIVELADRR